MKVVSYEEGKELVKRCVCGECGAPLTLPWGGAYGINSHIVRCSENLEHEGFVKQASYTEIMQRGEAIPIEVANVIERKEKSRMAEQLGDQSKALEVYHTKALLSQDQAKLILRTIWPDAPDVEVAKAAITCAMYNLNPLMKHLFLIPFKDQKTGENTWAQVIGINATRLMASRRRRYGYVDGPRRMTEGEQKDILGEVDHQNIWAITVVGTPDGSRAPGYGSWPRNRQPYGTEKGNTQLNMAMLRSERNALSRLVPGEMPQDVEVYEEAYLPALPQVGEVETPPSEYEAEFGELPKAAEGPQAEPSSDHSSWLKVCPRHNEPWFKDNFGKLTHKNEDGSWCKSIYVFGEWFGLACMKCGWAKDDNTLDINDFLKRNFDGRTWSKMSPEEQLQAIEMLRVKADEKAAQPPLVKEALGMGAELVEEEIAPTELPF